MGFSILINRLDNHFRFFRLSLGQTFEKFCRIPEIISKCGQSVRNMDGVKSSRSERISPETIKGEFIE